MARLKPNLTRSDILRTSSWAMLDMMVSRSSASGISVLMLSDSNNTPTPHRSNSCVYWMLSSVLREKREISLVTIKSKWPN